MKLRHRINRYISIVSHFLVKSQASIATDFYQMDRQYKFSERYMIPKLSLYEIEINYEYRIRQDL